MVDVGRRTKAVASALRAAASKMLGSDAGCSGARWNGRKF